ncbi:PLP-dependent aminotransferase family protein [Pelagibius sp. Alg239-R121]|uniref:MocR-like pyridoxine biosynthesis transcription factor PdxR n=1 Tax=Pelagibius sp. Alg239-R121 TaxID=2993448 RepID=UPI0024A67A24|nr:PLP-dependent aminotransferase family protein [Pelagibius sp. Alg239-R121]
MADRRLSTPLLALDLDRKSKMPLHRQLYDQIREAVLTGRLAPGARLPSSRTLASELGCSRNTAVTAFDQLLSEGYLAGQVGSGTYISHVLPEDLLSLSGAHRRGRQQDVPEQKVARRRGLSKRGEVLAAFPRGRRISTRAFAPGVPELDLFPFDVWARLLGRVWRRPSEALKRHGDHAGYEPLRRAIADYLRTARGLACDWRQILITSGAQQGLDLVARTLLDPGDPVWFENPGYTGLRGPLFAAGAEAVPLPVDEEGISVAAGRARSPQARMAIVAPSHQYPLGITMSLARRLELLAWAREADAWIVEDDYDSEYRYEGRPLSALQSLDDADNGRVVYLGSFSKVMFPSLRLGYIVVPEDLIEPMGCARGTLDDHPTAITQPALAAFISEGHFAAHVRRMRVLYAARQAVLLEAIRTDLEGLLDAQPDEAGLHIVAYLSKDLARRMSDQEAADRAAAAGLAVSPLSRYYDGKPDRCGLMLGYAAVPEDEIRLAVKKLARVLSD